MALNNSLVSLKLNYCGIDETGAKYIQQILAFIDSKLEKLHLKGNLLKNEGVYQIFRALKLNNCLEKINLDDNQFGEDEELPPIVIDNTNKDLENSSPKNKNEKDLDNTQKMEQKYEKAPVVDIISETMKVNKTLGWYSFKFNGLFDSAATKFLEAIKEGKHVYNVGLSEHISNEIITEMKNIMKKHVPKGRKKKKGAMGMGMGKMGMMGM